MLRSICAVVLGVISWFVTAVIINRLLRAVLPGYTEAEAARTFTLPMQVCRLVMALLASLCGGLVCAAIAGRKSHAAEILACGLVVFFLPAHYNLWDKFPVWYHLFFLVTLAPAVLAGAALQPRFVNTPPPIAGPSDAT
jgi:hypothetical protein